MKPHRLVLRPLAEGLSGTALRISAAAIATAFISTSAMAEFEIPQVNVEAGSIEAEYRGAAHSGIPAGGDGSEDAEGALRQSHELEFQLAPSDYWMFRLAPGLTEPVDNGFGYNDLALETQVVLRELPEQGLGVALMLGYNVHFQESKDEPAEVEYGPIIEYAAGRWLLTLNPLLVEQTGDSARSGTGFEYASQLQYRFAEHWAVAALAFGEIEHLGEIPVDEQIHRAGATLYLILGDEEGEEESSASMAEDREASWKIGLGGLWGLTPSTSDFAMRLVAALEY